jgi:hypothetical protein
VREALQIIANDEAQHAALSAEVLAWCIAEGGEPVVSAVTAAASELPTRMYEPAIPSDVDADTLADHGMFNADDSSDGYIAILRDTLRHVPTVSAAV